MLRGAAERLLGVLENKWKFLGDPTTQNSSERIIAISVINTGFFVLIGRDWGDKNRRSRWNQNPLIR
jgi:hypothetical protein